MTEQAKTIDILFSILSLTEVNYLTPIAEKLIKNGYKVCFVIFHDAAKTILKNKNIPFYSVHQLKESVRYKKFNMGDLNALQQQYGITNIRDLFLREKLGYNRTDENKLLKKTVHYLQIMEKILDENDVKLVIQTTGIFAANQAVYYAARKRDIDHVFYEHSPFNNMALFLQNTFECNIPDEIVNSPPSAEDRDAVEKYVHDYNEQKFFRAAADNKHLYSDMRLKKIINAENAKKLKRKIYHKYISQEKEEYNEIGWVIRSNFRKLLQRMLLNSYYIKPENKNEKYIYFPFHVPSDTQLLARSPMFQFQEWLVEYLSRSIPFGYKLYIKEHPAAVGGYRNYIIKKLIKECGNISLVHPQVNSYDLISNSSLVVTVNSSVGFEALLQDKKVLVMGTSYYKNCGVTFDVNDMNDLGSAIDNALNSEKPDRDNMLNFLTMVRKWSDPCALFKMEQESYDSFYKYLQTASFKRLTIKEAAKK